LPGAAPYNSAFDWTEYTGTANCLSVIGDTSNANTCNANYSPETQINAGNVAALTVSWIFPIPSTLNSPTAFTTRVLGYAYGSGGNEGTQDAVLSANGMGYILTNYLNIYGINLETGAQLATPSSCTVPTGSSLGAVIATDAKTAAPNSGTPCLGAAGEMDPAYDFAAWLAQPMASGGPTHNHGWNIVNVGGSAGDTAWVGGWGCSIQGWSVATGTLVANLTGMCGSKANPVPGTISPVVGSGHTFSNGNGEVQVDVKNNEIIFWAAGSGEGSGGFVDNIYACSLSLALSQYVAGTGSQCVPNYATSNGGACNTTAGGVCSSGSSMLWRTFLMPAYDGTTPNFAVNLCAAGHIWVAGVPCSAIEAENTNIIQVDGQRPDLAASQDGGDAVFPSTGCSGSWGQIAIDDADGVLSIGTGDTGPDWNSTLRMGFSILCNAEVGVSLTGAGVMWSDKSFTKDINDQDCNLNVSFTNLSPTGANTNNPGPLTGAPIKDVPAGVTASLMPNGGGVFVKTCKSSMTFAFAAATGQPLWYFDPSMPDYTTLGATTSPYSRAMACSPTNATACDTGKVWDTIAHRIVLNGTYPNSYISGTVKMVGSNPHPHGFITGGPTRGSANLDPLNTTEVGGCTGVNVTGNSITAAACTVGATCPTGMHAACVANDVQGKGAGYYEERYMAESEDGIDPQTGVYFAVVMSGPQEHDWIGDVNKQGQSGNVSGTNLYFGGQQTTNATEVAIQISTGQVLWNFTRPIYYRGGIIIYGAGNTGTSLSNNGVVEADWPDGHLIFNSEATGAVLKDINVGVPLLAPISIAPDQLGVFHVLISYGGTNHGILGEAGLHGPLGHGYVTTGAVISYVLGAITSQSVSVSTVTNTSTVTSTNSNGSVTTSVVTSTSTVSGTNSIQTTTVSNGNVSNLAFYGAVGVAAILAIVAGALVVLRRRPSA